MYHHSHPTARNDRSQLVHALLQHDLIDELFLHVHPVALGKGKRVFPDRIDAKFKLASAHPYPTGVVGLSYTRGR